MKGSKFPMKRPDIGVCTIIRPSKIHGVGVFAIKNIKKGTYIFPEDNDNMVWIKKSELGKITDDIKQLYEDFCVVKGEKYGCPKNFNKMTVAWYINHSKKPNTGCNKNYNFFATRDIRKGEELTADYTSYSDISDLTS
jgi:SET domain-containing protein